MKEESLASRQISRYCRNKLRRKEMKTGSYTIGVDYGSASVRAAIVDISDGSEVASGVFPYAFGVDGNLLDPSDPRLVRQDPNDYLKGLEVSIVTAIAKAKETVAGFSPSSIKGIGIDTTGTTVMPILKDGTPLAFLDGFKDEPSAYIWLWKDHTSTAEAEEITEKAKDGFPEYMDMVGGTYSSEWYWAKVLHCLRSSRHTFDAAYTWVEVADWLPFVITGGKDVSDMRRCVCAAAHKALFNPEWGGYPSKEFIEKLDPALIKVLNTLDSDKARDASRPAGMLSEEWTRKLGLPSPVIVTMSAFDAHYGGIGAGIKPGVLVKTIGTSTCDLAVLPKTGKKPIIPGMAGICHDTILPGYYGIEAGQSAVGDIFNWFVKYIKPEGKSHKELGQEAARLKVGESGLLALDWHNGNRTILVDQRLSGMILGLTLQTRPCEIYRALIEATAFGARVIHEQMEQNGLKIDDIIVCGGIPKKDKLLMQIYADIFKKTVHISRNAETCALGGAIVAAYCAGEYSSIEEAMEHMTQVSDEVFVPDPESMQVYDRLYALYRKLHDAFGKTGIHPDVSEIMKDLIDIKMDASH